MTFAAVTVPTTPLNCTIEEMWLMSTLRSVAMMIVALLLVLLEGCAGIHGGGKRLTNSDVTIVSFGSVNGELAPCG